MTEGCNCRQPTFGMPGERRPTHCRKHAPAGAVDVVHKRCAFEKCNKHPHFGLPGGKRTHCSTHAPAGSVDLTNNKDKRCVTDGCNHPPTFGFLGHKPTHCSTHAPAGAVDAVSTLCMADGCKYLRRFGAPGEYPTHCRKHAPVGAVDLVNKRKCCAFEGCIKDPHYGKPGGKRTHCSTHAPAGSVDLTNNKDKRCAADGCLRTPTFGLPEQKPMHCRHHAPVGTVNVTYKQCAAEGCGILPLFGLPGGKPTHCSTHKPAGAVDLYSKKCTAEGCVDTRANPRCIAAGHVMCMRCFVFTFPDHKLGRAARVKERHVADALRAGLPDDIAAGIVLDRRVDGGCSRRRPDVRIERGSHSVIVEIDEDQHETYDCTCNNKRTMQLYQDLGYRPLVMIRFNPDRFVDRSGKVHPSCFTRDKHGLPRVAPRKTKEWAARLRELVRAVESHIYEQPSRAITEIHLFFDGSI
jgi:hypothetical protein